MSKETLNCILFSLQKDFFLLPEVAVAEIIYLNQYDKEISWRELTLPLVTVNLSLVDPKSLHHPKVAILHALFSKNVTAPPFFAALFDGRPRKMRVDQHSLVWENESEKKALWVKEGEDKIKMTILDLYRLSSEIEQNFPAR